MRPSWWLRMRLAFAQARVVGATKQLQKAIALRARVLREAGIQVDPMAGRES